VPSTSTSGIPVDLPRICYVAGCTDPAPVTVPVPGASAGNGHVAVLYYNGQYVPVAVGTSDLITIGSTVLNLAGSAVGIALAEANDVIDVVQGLPTLDEIAQAVLNVVGDELVVKSWVGEVGRSSMTFEQVAVPADQPDAVSARARVRAVWIGEDRRPARIPSEVRAALGVD